MTYILREGSTSATLRDLAGAEGSNNRMLLYYLKSKEELLCGAIDAALLRCAVLSNLDNHLAGPV
jgi:hypothetical protein